MSTLFQYLFAALDEQKKFLVSTIVGSTLRIVSLSSLIPTYGFVGPSIAFVCAETLIVGIWIFQISKLGYPANLGSLMWRPLAAGAAMAMRALLRPRVVPHLAISWRGFFSLWFMALGLFVLQDLLRVKRFGRLVRASLSSPPL